MVKRTFTCPFTGVNFDTLESAEGNIIAHHPITGETMRLAFNHELNSYLLPREYMKFTETVSSTEAADILQVSRARISKIVADNVIPHFIVNGKAMFCKSDIMEYAETRTVGRPAKEL